VFPPFLPPAPIRRAVKQEPSRLPTDKALPRSARRSASGSRPNQLLDSARSRRRRVSIWRVAAIASISCRSTSAEPDSICPSRSAPQPSLSPKSFRDSPSASLKAARLVPNMVFSSGGMRRSFRLFQTVPQHRLHVKRRTGGRAIGRKVGAPAGPSTNTKNPAERRAFAPRGRRCMYWLGRLRDVVRGRGRLLRREAQLHLVTPFPRELVSVVRSHSTNCRVGPGGRFGHLANKRCPDI
jgi:hypothetical protein